MWLENPAVARATEHGGWQKLLQGTSVLVTLVGTRKVLDTETSGTPKRPLF